MHPIEYASPNTREQAVKLLGTDPAAAAPLAGGSDLLALMKDGVETPKRLVSLKGIAGLTSVRTLPSGPIATSVSLHAVRRIANQTPCSRRSGCTAAGTPTRRGRRSPNRQTYQPRPSAK